MNARPQPPNTLHSSSPSTLSSLSLTCVFPSSFLRHVRTARAVRAACAGVLRPQVLDEAHGVKNMKTARWAHLKALKTKHRLLLSGTPVQNNLRELLVLLDFLSPSVFKFRSGAGRAGGAFDDGDQRDPVGELLAGLGIGEDGKSALGGGAGGAAVRQVRCLLAPFVLRRLKSQVLLQLAPKTVHEVALAPRPSQQALYDSILRRHIERQQVLGSF